MLYYQDRRRLHNGRGFNRIISEKHRYVSASGIVEDIVEPIINLVKDNKDLLKNASESVVNTQL